MGVCGGCLVIIMFVIRFCSCSYQYQTDTIGCYASFGVFKFEQKKNADSTMHQ